MERESKGKDAEQVSMGARKGEGMRSGKRGHEVMEDKGGDEEMRELRRT